MFISKSFNFINGVSSPKGTKMNINKLKSRLKQRVNKIWNLYLKSHEIMEINLDLKAILPRMSLQSSPTSSRCKRHAKNGSQELKSTTRRITDEIRV